MRFFLFSLLTIVTVSSALNCYIGGLSIDKKDENPTVLLMPCEDNQGCCYFIEMKGVTRYYGCREASECPTFKANENQVFEKRFDDGSFIYFCRKATGACKYNG